MARLPLLGFGAALVVASACATFKSQAYLPCAQPCTLAIQNDAGVDVSMRYADTAGTNDRLGWVRPGSVGVYRLQWIKSAKLRIMLVTRDGGRYDTFVMLKRAGPVQIHFPADFKPVETAFVP